MQPIKRNSLIEQVILLLREEIAGGRWPVGSRIPTEPELMRVTGAGRNTVREAVQALVHAGLLERRQGSGTYVLTDSGVTAALRREIATARRRDLLELRRALEVTAAGLAAVRREEHEVAHMRELLAQVSGLHASGDTAGAARADAALHRAVVAAAHNTAYLQVYEGVVPSMEQDMRVEIDETGTVHLREHTALVDAIEAGDAALAESTMHGFLGDLLARDGDHRR